MVLGTRCTQTKAPTAALTIFNIAVWPIISNGPRLAIQVFKHVNIINHFNLNMMYIMWMSFKLYL